MDKGNYSMEAKWGWTQRTIKGNTLFPIGFRTWHKDRSSYIIKPKFKHQPLLESDLDANDLGLIAFLARKILFLWPIASEDKKKNSIITLLNSIIYCNKKCDKFQHSLICIAMYISYFTMYFPWFSQNSTYSFEII